MQQDAEECWTNILASLRDKLKASAPSHAARHSGPGAAAVAAPAGWLAAQQACVLSQAPQAALWQWD